MQVEFRVISIGTLATHPLWNEQGQVRTGHATTILIRVGESNILVDPSLPAPVLLARMSERTEVRPEEITHVFLTSFERERLRAITAFDAAEWLLHEPERECARESLDVQLKKAKETGEDELVRLLEVEWNLLDRFQTASDALAPGVDLFPLPGMTPGTCGLLLALPSMTVLVCGDAVATMEHLVQGKVLAQSASLEQAQESFAEAVEIADVLILGRDNIALNPIRRLM